MSRSSGPIARRLPFGVAILVTSVLFAPLAAPLASATPPDPADPTGGLQEDRACQVLTIELLFDFLGIEPVETDRSVNSAATYWSCTYTWQSETATTSMEIAGRTMAVPAENRFGLSISNTEDSDPDAAYETSTGALTSRWEHEEVADVGDRAIWVPEIPQLSVQSGDDVFHLTVDYADGEEDNLELAKRLAGRIMERLD